MHLQTNIKEYDFTAGAALFVNCFVSIFHFFKKETFDDSDKKIISLNG